MEFTEKDVKRFWAKVAIGAPAECWEWQAGTNRGYGQFVLDGCSVKAHRFACELHRGVIPDGMVIMHMCDNRSCCNPAHLKVGTQAANVADMCTKGRARGGSLKGATNGRAKLTETDVRAIRADTRAHRVIAADYNVSRTHVSAIKRREIWKHLP